MQEAFAEFEKMEIIVKNTNIFLTMAAASSILWEYTEIRKVSIFKYNLL